MADEEDTEDDIDIEIYDGDENHEEILANQNEIIDLDEEKRNNQEINRNNGGFIDLSMDSEPENENRDVGDLKNDENREDNVNIEEHRDIIDLTLDEPEEEDNKQIEDRKEDEEFHTITVESYGVSGVIRTKYKNRDDAKWSRPNLTWKNKRLVRKSGASSWICTMDERNCKLKFTRSTLLWEHMENKHMMGEGAFHCDWIGCDKKYTHKAGLFAHIRSIHVGPLDDQYKYECKVCGRKHQNQMAKYRCCRNPNGRQ